MSEVVLSNRQLNPEQLIRFCGLGLEELNSCGCAKPTFVAANTPYLVGADTSDTAILAQLSPPRVASDLTNLSLALGSDSLLPLAKLRENLHEAGVGLLGEAAAVSNRRGSQFVHAVKGYQQALLDYRKAVVSSGSNKASAKLEAQRAFDQMQRQFGKELNAVAAQVKTQRGTPLTSAQRGINIATSSRNIAKLHVANQIEANILVKLTRHAKGLGNGLAVITFGAKVGSVHNEYLAAGDWHRQMFIESSSFALSASAGLIAGNMGGAGLGLLIMATPAGWVGVVAVVGGLAVAGTVAGISIAMNRFTQESAGAWYDSAMKAIGSL